MSLEDLTGISTYLDALVETNPVGATDSKAQGDDHIRGIKNVLKNTFPSLTGAVTATAAELNILDGVTATTAELNILDGVTATAAELNKLDGVTSTAAELNILDGVTATAAELNILDGVTATAAELNILDGVTATTAELNILDGVTATAAEINKLDGLTTSLAGLTATMTELNKLDGATVTTAEINKLDGLTSTTTELNYTDGVTSNIQTQLNSKLESVSDASTTAKGIIELATQTETNAGTDTTRAVTPSTLKNLNLGQLKAANGYVKLPGGIIIQWGNTDNGVFLFPIAFPTSVFSVSICPKYWMADPNYYESAYVSALTTTSMTVRTAVRVGTPFYAIAIGY